MAAPNNTEGTPQRSWTRPQNVVEFFYGVRLFEAPKDLWDAAAEYFDWVEENPILTEKVFCSNGVVVRANTPRARVMTIHGLCLYLNISRDTFHKWSVGTDREDLMPVCQMIRDVIYAQKFEGAAADVFNAGVISRDLGLRDVKELSGPNGGPMQMINSDMSPQEAAAAYAATLQGLED